MKRAKNRPRLRSRWVQQSGRLFAVVQFLRRLRSDVIHQDQDQGHQSDAEQNGRCGANWNHFSAQSQISSLRAAFCFLFATFFFFSWECEKVFFSMAFSQYFATRHVWAVFFSESEHVDLDNWTVIILAIETILRFEPQTVQTVSRSLSQKCPQHACVGSPPKQFWPWYLHRERASAKRDASSLWPVCERSADLARSVGIGWLSGYLI